MNASNLGFRSRLMVVLSAAFLGLMVVNTLVLADELKQAMKEMKYALNGAMNSSPMNEFTKYAARLQSGVSATSRVNFSDNAPVYRRGMDKLRQDIEKMDNAIKANDLGAAKDALRQINTIRKHYHNELG